MAQYPKTLCWALHTIPQLPCHHWADFQSPAISQAAKVRTSAAAAQHLHACCSLSPASFTYAVAMESRGRHDAQQHCSDAAAPAPSPPVQMLRKYIPASGALMALLLCVAASYVAGQGKHA